MAVREKLLENPGAVEMDQSPFEASNVMKVQGILDVMKKLKGEQPTTSYKTPEHHVTTHTELTVLNKSPLEDYREGKQHFYASLADDTGSFLAEFFCPDHHTQVIENCGLLVSNYYVKATHVIVTVKSTVALMAPVDISDEIVRAAVALPDKKQALVSALNSPTKKLQIRGKVIQSADGPGYVPKQSIIMKDGTGKVKTSLWGKLTSVVSVGDHVQLTDVNPYNLRGEKILTTTKTSKLEFIKDEELDGLSSDDDIDGDLLLESCPLVYNFTIKALSKVSVYNSCNKKRCNNKKLDSDEKSPRCNAFYENSDTTAAKSVVLNIMATQEGKEGLQVITMFTAHLFELLSAYGKEVQLTTSDALKIELIKLMRTYPGVPFSCTLNNGCVQVLRVKRKTSD